MNGKRFLFLSLMCLAAFETRAQVSATRVLHALDFDQNGSLSQGELPPVFHGTFREMDLNRDGGLAEIEIPTDLRRYFSAFDKDQNGEFSSDELMQVRRLMSFWDSYTGARLLAKLDRSGDGVVSAEEAPTRLRREFRRLDADGDGALTANELTVQVDFDDQGRIIELTRVPGLSAVEQRRVFAALDDNDNGRLTEAELPNSLILNFARLDANRDGGIAWAEISTNPLAGVIFRSFVRYDLDQDGELSDIELVAVSSAERLLETHAGPQLIRRWDLDGDERLAAVEFKAKSSWAFSRFDRDRDEALTAEELADFRVTFNDEGVPLIEVETPPSSQRSVSFTERQKTRLFDRLDRNRDGSLTLYELPYTLHALVGQMDNDNDGRLQPGDLQNDFWSGFAPQDTNRDGEISAREMATIPQHAPQDGILTTHRLLAVWDADKNGTLSKTETPPLLQYDFEELDHNRDAQIQATEFTHLWVEFDQNGNPTHVRLPETGKTVAASDKIANDERRHRLVELLKRRRRGE